MRGPTLLIAAALAVTVTVAKADLAATRVEHVVIIGLDGARPEALQRASGPVLRGLIEAGSVSWDAQATHPTVTQVNWASMLTGCLPDRHGIDRHPVTQEELAPQRVRVPSIFSLVARSGREAVGFFGHWKLHPLKSDEPGTTFVDSPYEARRVGPLAAEYLRTRKPALCFVWMGDLDGRGHQHGWLSDEQLAAMPEIDDALSQIVDALREAGTWDRTLLIVSADHGGHDRGHGGGTPADATIPWLVVGPGVRAGHRITGPVSICDTAATALFALGLPRPEDLEGRPVLEVFIGEAAEE